VFTHDHPRRPLNVDHVIPCALVRLKRDLALRDLRSKQFPRELRAFKFDCGHMVSHVLNQRIEGLDLGRDNTPRPHHEHHDVPKGRRQSLAGEPKNCKWSDLSDLDVKMHLYFSV
jgi:hypothetical protein